MQIENKIIHESKFSKKCPYILYPKFITIHETANDASAENEIAYMHGNPNQVSFHFAVDDKEIIQGLPLTRNAWHAGDGTFGDGNRESLSIEICYSKSGGSRYEQAKANAAGLAAYLLNDYKLPIIQLKKHQDWSGKHCPHRMISEDKWNEFVELVKKKMEGEKMDFKNGYQSQSWLRQKVHIYKLSGKEKIGIIALPHGNVLDITKFELPVKGKIKCILNCHYFEMGKSNDYLGRCQSFTTDDRTPGKGEENFKGYKDTDDKPYMDWVILKDGSVKAGDFNSWDYPKEEVILGLAPAGVEILNGDDVNKYSPECGYGKITTPNTQSLILKCSDGTFALVACAGNLTPLQLRDMAKAYGCTEQCCLDSGGSTQMLVNGEKKRYTGRAIPTCVVIYEEEEEQPEPGPTPEPVQGELKLFVAKVGLNIRASLSFSNGRADGEKIGFIPVGEEAVITRFFNGIKPDGYQWVEVIYKGIIGCCQYDSQSYWIKQEI